MVAVYVALIINSQKWTINRVPQRFKSAVLEELKALDLDGNGNQIEEA